MLGQIKNNRLNQTNSTPWPSRQGIRYDRGILQVKIGLWKVYKDF